MFTDEEWDITKYPMVALYQNNVSPTKDPANLYTYQTVKRLSYMAPQSKFYANGKVEPDDVAQGRLHTRVFHLVIAYSQ